MNVELKEIKQTMRLNLGVDSVLSTTQRYAAKIKATTVHCGLGLVAEVPGANTKELQLGYQKVVT